MIHQKLLHQDRQNLQEELHLVDKTLLAMMVVARYKKPDINPEELAQMAEERSTHISRQILKMSTSKGISGLEILDKLIKEEVGKKQEEKKNLLNQIKGGEIVAILPLPPHVTDWFFLNNIKVNFVHVENHHLPPHLRILEVVTSLKDAVSLIKNSKCIALEGYMDSVGNYYLPSLISYAILPHLPVDAKIIFHSRPHKHITDEWITIENEIVMI